MGKDSDGEARPSDWGAHGGKGCRRCFCNGLAGRCRDGTNHGRDETSWNGRCHQAAGVPSSFAQPTPTWPRRLTHNRDARLSNPPPPQPRTSDAARLNIHGTPPSVTNCCWTSIAPRSSMWEADSWPAASRLLDSRAPDATTPYVSPLLSAATRLDQRD